MVAHTSSLRYTHRELRLEELRDYYDISWRIKVSHVHFFGQVNWVIHSFYRLFLSAFLLHKINRHNPSMQPLLSHENFIDTNHQLQVHES